MVDAKASDAARKLGELGASKGGRARAEKLPPEKRSEIARKAAEARWGSDLPLAAYGSPDRPLRIGDVEIPCYVLEDGRRVIVQSGMISALGMVKGGSSHRGTRLAKFVGQNRLKPFCSQELLTRTENPIRFRTRHGTQAFGYEATILADICDVVLDARNAGVLTQKQLHVADQCEILVRSFAKLGIVALVDEVTGYQADRARDALEKILQKFISDELSRWVKRFPDEFYKELFRLRDVDMSTFPAKTKRPQYIGHLTNDIVYKRLAPGVLDELKRLTPRDGKGRRKHQFHRRLTEDIGHPRLQEHLHAVIALMKVSKDWKQFKQMLNTALPLWEGGQKLLEFRD